MISRRWRERAAHVVLLPFFTSLVACGGAPETPPPSTTSTVPVPAPAPPPPTLPTQVPEQLSKDQLRELVAPVALYPDVILASLLPATTYPDQVDAAALYVAQQGGTVQTVPEDRNWDGSVAGLLQFPDVLTWLSGNDPWAEQMGTAVTYQQGDVLDAVQDYRQLALDAGNLKSNEYMQVTKDADQDIRIAPAQPDTVYVPQYNPVAATQPQAQTGINPWLAFGGGVAVGALGAWALYSIFDDDDDNGGGYHNKKVVKTYNNYYYYGGQPGQRPPANAWKPRPVPYRQQRQNRPPAGTVLRPTPYKPVQVSTKPAQRPGGGGGLRPPAARPAAAPAPAVVPTQKQNQKQKVAQPTPAPQPKQGAAKGKAKQPATPQGAVQPSKGASTQQKGQPQKQKQKQKQPQKSQPQKKQQKTQPGAKKKAAPTKAGTP